MKLYGTLTSPYVRRVRVVADALGVPYERIDTQSEAGQAALRALTPIWKVPVVQVDGHAIFDSRAIVEYLLRTRGYDPFRPVSPHGFVRESNFMHSVDTCLDIGIRRFYLTKDRPDISAPYLDKEVERMHCAMKWVADQVQGPWATDEQGFGFAELVLYTALDWMRFREAYDITQHPSFVEFMEIHAEQLGPTAPDAIVPEDD